MSSSGSQTSSRPPPKPEVLNPIDSNATLPARIMRSAQEIFRPYFCFIGQSNRRALSRLALSGQLLRGAKRWKPEPCVRRQQEDASVPVLRLAQGDPRVVGEAQEWLAIASASDRARGRKRESADA